MSQGARIRSAAAPPFENGSGKSGFVPADKAIALCMTES